MKPERVYLRPDTHGNVYHLERTEDGRPVLMVSATLANGDIEAGDPSELCYQAERGRVRFSDPRELDAEEKAECVALFCWLLAAEELDGGTISPVAYCETCGWSWSTGGPCPECGGLL